MIKVKHLQSKEVLGFSYYSEFFFYLLGLCEGGRHPVLHISSDSTDDCDSFDDYSVIIEYHN